MTGRGRIRLQRVYPAERRGCECTPRYAVTAQAAARRGEAPASEEFFSDSFCADLKQKKARPGLFGTALSGIVPKRYRKTVSASLDWTEENSIATPSWK